MRATLGGVFRIYTYKTYQNTPILKLKLLFFVLVLYVGWTYGQAIPQFNMKDTTVDDCDGNLLDSDEEFGGRYGKNENFTFTICPGLGGTVILDFAFLNLEAPYDSISFYNGPNTSSPYLGSYTGQQIPGPTIVATSGCLTIVFVSDGTVQLTGWDATWQTVSPPVVPPVMSISTVAPPICNSNRFEIEFDRNVHCDSIVIGAFQLTGPNSPVIQSVNPLNCLSDSTMAAEVILANPLIYNCDYTLDFNLNILDICDSLWEFVLSDNFTISNCQIPYTISPDDTICVTNCTDVEVIPIPGCSPLTYVWDNGLSATAGPHNVCPTTTTTYHVTITEVNSGVIAYDSVTVYVQDSLDVNVDMSYSTVNQPQCGNTAFNVIFTPGLPCNLIDSGNFVFNVVGNPPQVASFLPLNCTAGLTDSVQITLTAPFSGDCNYALDYNLIFTDPCVGPQNLTYSDTFDLTGCPIAGTVSYPDTLCTNSCDSVTAIVNGCSSYTYTWSNGWPNAPGPFVICPNADSTITVTITDDSTGMFYTETFTITVIPSGVDIQMAINQTGLNCLSDSILLNFSAPVNCADVIDTNFRLIGGADTIIINSVTPVNCIGGITTSFRLQLPANFQFNCNYMLEFSLDTVNSCGDSVRITSIDSVMIVDCPLPYNINYTEIVCEDRCTQVRVDPIPSCFDVHYIWSNGAADTNRINVCPDYDTVVYLEIHEDTTGYIIYDTIRIEVDSSFDDFIMELDSTKYLPACDSLKIFTRFNRPVPCDSIRTADFRLRGDNADIPIVNVIGIGCVNPGDSAEFLEIELASPLDFYDEYRLIYYVNGNECSTTVTTDDIYIERHNTDFTFNDTCYYQFTQFTAVIDSLVDLDSVRWDFGEPASGQSNTSSNLNEQHEYLSPGTYNVTFLAYYSCEVDTVQKTVVISDPLVVDITGRLSVCTGVTTLLDAGPGFVTYLWSNAGTNQTTTVTAAGQYDVVVGDGSGCRTGRDTVDVVEIPELTPVIDGPLSYCPGTGTTLDAGVYDSYQWSTGAITQTIYTNIPGAYSVIVFDTLGCPGFDTVDIFLGANLPASITGNTTLCPGLMTILDAGADYVLYRWSTGDTTQSIINVGPGNYFVFVQDSAGCSGYDTVDVIQYPEVDLDIFGDKTFCLGSAGYLTATTGYTGYHWSTGEVGVETIMVSSQGYYDIRVLDPNSCWAYDTVFVSTDTCIDTCNVIIPNAFTPNGDGANDFFGPEINRCNLEIFEFSIFDRWGIKVFETEDVEIKWDGLFKNDIVESDVFVWKLKYKDYGDPRTFNRMGHVSIIK